MPPQEPIYRLCFTPPDYHELPSQTSKFSATPPASSPSEPWHGDLRTWQSKPAPQFPNALAINNHDFAFLASKDVKKQVFGLRLATKV